MKQEWAENTEKDLITGILLWDLSAVFDTLSADILCAKLKIYGFNDRSCNWFNSFLTGRSKQVKIGRTLSSKRSLESGVPNNIRHLWSWHGAVAQILICIDLCWWYQLQCDWQIIAQPTQCEHSVSTIRVAKSTSIVKKKSRN